jgi:hypothetical protein
MRPRVLSSAQRHVSLTRRFPARFECCLWHADVDRVGAERFEGPSKCGLQVVAWDLARRLLKNSTEQLRGNVTEIGRHSLVAFSRVGGRLLFVGLRRVVAVRQQVGNDGGNPGQIHLEACP